MKLDRVAYINSHLKVCRAKKKKGCSLRQSKHKCARQHWKKQDF